MVGIRLAPALQPKRLAIVGSHRTAAANIGFTVGLRPQQLSRQDTDAQAPAAPTELNRDSERRRSYLHHHRRRECIQIRLSTKGDETRCAARPL
jgi:hypothetical protein